MFTIGKAKFELLEREIAFEGKPIRATEELVGKLTSYKVTTSDLSVIIFGIVTWPDGASEIIPIDFVEGEQKYSKLATSGRMSIINVGNDWVGELKAMKFNPSTKLANLATATVDELEDFAEAKLLPTLTKFGRVSIGTREELHGETNKNRARLAFRCEAGNKDLAAAVYVITRVLAVLKDHGM